MQRSQLPVSKGQLVAPNQAPQSQASDRRRVRPPLRYAIWACALAAGAGVFLISAGKPLDSSFPKLSEFVRYRMPDTNSVDHQGYELTQSLDAYLRETSACRDREASFEACRSVLLAAEPALNHLEFTLDNLARVWQRQIIENSMSDVCEGAGSDEYLAWSEYISAQRRLLALLKPLDSGSLEGERLLSEQFQPNAVSDAAAVRRLNNLPPWPAECARYWPAVYIESTFRDGEAAFARW